MTNRAIILLIILTLLILAGILDGCASSSAPAAAQPALSSQTSEPGSAYPTPQPMMPYPLGTPGVAYPSYGYQPAPYPTATPDASQAARIADKETQIAVIAMTMTAEPSPTPMPTLSAEQKAANLEQMKRMMKSVGAIMLEDNGKTFTYHLSERFFVFLDDEQYPRSELVCEPQPVIGYISNGDFRGPDLYPIYL